MLNKAINWSGVWTAIVTPLRLVNKNLELDEKSLESLLNRQIAEGIKGFVIGGSTGEGSLLPEKLFEQHLVSVKKIVGTRVPLVAGLGIGGTESCLKNARLAITNGYDGLLASPPAYVKAPQDALAEHFLEIAALGTPVCLYEVPGRAASSIQIETLVKIVADVRAKNIVAIKDASGDVRRCLDEKKYLGDRLALLSGDDGTFSAFLSAGGTGVISVVSHVACRQMSLILENAKSGNFKEATRLQNQLQPLIDLLFVESNPIPVKSLVHSLGWIENSVFVKPLRPMNPEKLSKLKETYEQTK